MSGSFCRRYLGLPTVSSCRSATLLQEMLRAFAGHEPSLGEDVYVDESAVVIGRVLLGPRASVWPNAVIRGDSDDITIGPDTNIQDGVVVHVDAGVPCTIGARVTIGHLACVHGCTVEDETLIGIGAVLLNGSRICTGSIVGAKALVTEGTEIPPGSLALGTPAKVVKRTTEAQREAIVESAAHYARAASQHRG
jgi:carbonic anhydrase/acetyltransferase-like protein (isoleucine patch superfamily)